MSERVIDSALISAALKNGLAGYHEEIARTGSGRGRRGGRGDSAC